MFLPGATQGRKNNPCDTLGAAMQAYGVEHFSDPFNIASVIGVCSSDCGTILNTKQLV